MVKENTNLDQAVVFVVTQFPRAFFPVPVSHHTRSPRDSTCSSLSTLPLLARRALDSRFSFGAILSIDTRGSWRSLGPSRSQAALVTFGSVTGGIGHGSRDSI